MYFLLDEQMFNLSLRFTNFQADLIPLKYQSFINRKNKNSTVVKMEFGILGSATDPSTFSKFTLKFTGGVGNSLGWATGLEGVI